MTLVTREAPALGEILGEGRFELQARLGEGGMSVVYRARDRVLDREVALKLLLPRYVGRPEREQRLINEADYLRRLQGHPNIIEFVDSGRLGGGQGWPWLATEVLSGKSLDWVLVRGRLGLPRILRVARQVLMALRACHAAGIVHRDATPSNVFELDDEGGTIKLFDFSHAAELDGPRCAVGERERLTGVFDVPGTLGYMSPEQVQQDPAEPAMDVFGFGILLYELVTGKNPYGHLEGRGAFIKAQREGTLKPPRLHAWAYQVPQELGELVRACTREVNQRPTVEGILDRLDALEAEALEEPPEATVRMDAIARQRTEAQALPEVTAVMTRPAIIDATVPEPALVDGIGDWVRRGGRGVAAAPGLTPAVAGPGSGAKTVEAVELAFARPPGQRERESSLVSEDTRPERRDAEREFEPRPTDEDPRDDPAPVNSSRARWWGLGAIVFLLAGAAWVWWSRNEDAAPDPAAETDGHAPAPDSIPMEGSPESATGPRLEPVPEVEAPSAHEHEVEPEPRPRPQSKPKPKPKPHPKPEPAPQAGPETEPESPPDAGPDCATVEQEAQAAADRLDWKQVLALTRHTKCWASPRQRTLLRVRALSEMGRWDDCVEAAAGSKDPRVMQYADDCRAFSK